jgi:hypothetical protein
MLMLLTESVYVYLAQVRWMDYERKNIRDGGENGATRVLRYQQHSAEHTIWIQK